MLPDQIAIALIETLLDYPAASRPSSFFGSGLQKVADSAKLGIQWCIQDLKLFHKHWRLRESLRDKVRIGSISHGNQEATKIILPHESFECILERASLNARNAIVSEEMIDFFLRCTYRVNAAQIDHFIRYDRAKAISYGIDRIVMGTLKLKFFQKLGARHRISIQHLPDIAKTLWLPW